MLLTGIISIFQIIFIPGFILINLLKIKTDSSIQKWLYIFSFSLFFNYGLVMVLTLLSVYTSAAMWGILIFEIVLMLLFCRPSLASVLNNFNFRDAFLDFYKFVMANTSANRIIIIISTSVILFYTAVFFANIGTIFYFIDTVNNYEWNSWAIDFANNILPKFSSHFPQLLPANWSISYVLIGKTDVHFFPKAIMPLFFIGNLLIFIDLAFSRKNYVFLIGLIIYGIFGPIVYSLVFIADGNADLPVSFFAFLTFYSFLKITQDNFELRTYMITFLFASMAAATKLAGFYTFTVASIVLGVLLFLNRNNLDRRSIFNILLFTFIISSISLFWYFQSPGEMVSGLHQPQYLPKTDYFNIGINAVKMMYNYFGPPVFVFFLVTISASLFHKRFKYISIVMVAIPTIIWMLKHSIDFRNFSFVVPFFSMCSAIGLSTILLYLSKNKSDEFFLNDNRIINEKFHSKNSSFYLSKKDKFSLLSISLISIPVLIFFLSNQFYLFLLDIYDFIDKYYFQRNRNLYFIEYDLLFHVDYYQRVLIVLSSFGIILPALVLTKIRSTVVIMFLVVGIVFINFTSVDSVNILDHQQECLNKVEARNYYNWLKMHIHSLKLKNEISTNFTSIIQDKVPRYIRFNYIENVSIDYLERNNKKNIQLFLKHDILSRHTKDYIKSKIKCGEFKLIFDDNYYLLFVINPI